MLRAGFRSAPRQTEGLIGSIPRLLGLNLLMSNFSTLSRLAQSLKAPAQPHATGGPIHLMVDSSGLKLGGPGEWLVEKYDTSRRRSWRKLHIGFVSIGFGIRLFRNLDDAGGQNGVGGAHNRNTPLIGLQACPSKFTP
ncbi:hypothetical protein N825_22650 [Skermanella stibiiresistens SB22]|uniref:Transposase DDE domain-containing protein n=1 Tax=Skermanella stibiiresistens SB22 TaxID=1385369 RepID=W9GT15_9PROT|nr:hypothetical protein N825_22650 [Skermanella stibiiresistens SB22]